VFEPEAAVIARVLARIFPTAERTGDPWQDLLAATARTEATRGLSWRWDSSCRPS
jgi:hypothetical protein